MSYKTTDGLMRHLRNNSIAISGSKEKKQLMNTGYFHGYKGYRFYNNSYKRLPFKSYSEVYSTIQYDSKLKSLLYSKIMFIETAVKNVALESILINSKSENIQNMYNNVISGYNNSPLGSTKVEKKHYQQAKLNLQNSIQNSLSKAYKSENKKITHYYNKAGYTDVPIWALFEIMTLGDFGYLLSCLNFDVRDDISKRLGLDDISVDSNRQLIYKYIYTLKDLRNAVAHNSVVFDTRFKNITPNKSMKLYLKNKIGVPYVNFKTIGDYIILICHYLKLLGVPKNEIKSFIRGFEKITKEYQNSVNVNVSTIVIHPDTFSRMKILKNYI